MFTALREGRLRDYRSEDCGEGGADGENLVQADISVSSGPSNRQCLSEAGRGVQHCL